jgi:pyruvate,water dikinase
VTGCVPPGFVITAEGYKQILAQNDLVERIRLLLHHIETCTDQDALRSRTETIRNWIKTVQLPEPIGQVLATMPRAIADGPAVTWAVRPSAVDEDSAHTFANLFDHKLYVGNSTIETAFLEILSSRFSDQALAYRINCGYREVKTPLAVLFMPMLEVAVRGSICTRDISRPSENIMEIHVLPDGESTTKPEVHTLSKGRTVRCIDGPGSDKPSIPVETLCAIGEMAWAAMDKIGYDIDIEWVLDGNGRIHFLQARRIAYTDLGDIRPAKQNPVLAMGGITIYPGRAEGNALLLKSPDQFSAAHKGSVVIVEKPLAAYSAILPDIAALLVIEGNPSDPLAGLAREYSVPCIFQMGPIAHRIVGKHCVSVNTAKRTVYRGSRWPGIRERVLTRIAEANRVKGQSPLFDTILKVTLSDPDDKAFKANRCTSIQDTILFMHEMSVQTMFGFGDQQNSLFNSRSCKLKTDLPLKCQLIDLDRSLESGKKSVVPDDIGCTPFNALWRGISDRDVPWSQHWDRQMKGVSRELKNAVLGEEMGPRRASDMNYAILSKDTLNFNARMSFHYIMVDSLVGDGTENNYIHFRFRAGGGIEKNRARTASFIEAVLPQLGFGLDRKGDTVTAWMRCYDRKTSETALENVGRLMVCAREVAAVLGNDTDITRFSDHFLKGNYDIFS